MGVLTNLRGIAATRIPRLQQIPDNKGGQDRFLKKNQETDKAAREIRDSLIRQRLWQK
jgi:hypothetical protein